MVEKQVGTGTRNGREQMIAVRLPCSSSLTKRDPGNQHRYASMDVGGTSSGWVVGSSDERMIESERVCNKYGLKHG